MEHLRASEALSLILESVPLSGVETVMLEQSLGRVLAEAISANRDLPPYDVSAMDGFAVRSVDVANAPTRLAIIEDIKAGDMPTKTVQAGQCARIMTGAPMPRGADAVIRVEDTKALPAGDVQIDKIVKPGNDVRPRGESMKNGDVVLTAGTEITPGVIGVLATVKAAQFTVYRRPSVAILSTGDELEGMRDPVDSNKIPESNTYALMGQVQALGIEPVLLGIARDEPAELRRYLQEGLQFDVLLVSGGTSVGVHDYVRPTLEALGVQMKFWRVAIKPGHPLAFGRADKTSVFGLPGNPVSSMVCFEEFVAPALRHMMGSTRLYRRTVTARLAHPVKFRPGRTEFVRVQLSRDAAGYIASSTGSQSSGVLMSMARADGLLVIPSDSTGLAEGEQVTVQLLDGTVFQDEIGYRE
ncbi:gephyrin-like molybdotransferase Glp [Sideroxydans sp. CL21]|uniref:molybdopterin molybdotransferase MoeA n=1 Tax=Sideroxydans sp. CL21 TaxID=2600596 RepID=UPI0024BCF24E|nr:gephyrin-like molybdotransferase Glp [Sideroxydans sp. CL21]